MKTLTFEQIFQSEIQLILDQKVKPKLLLHSCCAPCFTGCIERLKDVFSVTVLFYNPNMDSQNEFDARCIEQMRICSEFNVDFIKIDYNHQEFLDVINGKENCPEGGFRCFDCFYLRLLKTASFASENNFDYFATTLTLSPLKNAEKINQIGLQIQEKIGVKYLVSDFKKKGGYTRSIQLSKDLNLYRQNYCGCEFSKR
ncbi:MAG: epoxyqueuosine reductase QueH [Clostridia bacterium]|nr:epoxyqueuosine reductase QueH [Clostridia bacterium]